MGIHICSLAGCYPACIRHLPNPVRGLLSVRQHACRQSLNLPCSRLQMAMDSSSSSSSSEDECDRKPMQQRERMERGDALLQIEDAAPLLIENPPADGAVTGPAAGIGALLQPGFGSPGLPGSTLLQPGGGNNIVASPRPAEPERTRVAVCQGKACLKRGSAVLLEAATQQAAAYGKQLEVVPCKCLDKCKEGPNVAVRAPGGQRVIVTGVRSEMLPSLLRRSAVEAEAQTAC